MKSSLYAHINNKFSLPKCWRFKSGRPISPTQAAADPGEKVSFRALKRGSLTAEAALALPLFFMTVICVISIMGVYGAVLKDMIKLRDEAELAAVYTGAAGGDIWIELADVTDYRPYYLPSGLASVNIPVSAKVRSWTGRDESATAEGAEASASDYVYVTEYGSVYHTDPACTHIELSISAASASDAENMRNEYGSHYHACEKCIGSGAVNPVVYITEDGDCYHNSLECSGLKRSVRLVPAEEASGYEICSRCAAAGN